MEPKLFLEAVFAHWIATAGIILTLTPFVPAKAQKWVEERIMKDKFSLKHLWIVGAVLILFAVYQAWQDEHRVASQLIQEKAQLASDSNFWKGQSYDKDASLRKRDELLQQSITSFMGLSDKILDITKPESLKIIVAGERLPYYGGTQPHEMMMLAFPNKVAGAVDADVSCDKEIQSARAAMLGHDLWMGKGVQLDNDTHFHVNITSPVWTPTQPLVVYVRFKGELATVCKVAQQ